MTGAASDSGPGSQSHFRQRIHAGLKRLRTFQHENGMFSIWCGGRHGVDITARVAHRLLGFEGLPFDDAFEMRGEAAKALLESGYTNNQLLPLDHRFRAPLKTVADAVSLYYHSRSHREEALDYLRRTAESQQDATVCWPASSHHYWGGRLEATCDAARVMLDAGDALFIPAFRHVTSRLVDGMLYSTADTRALVELLSNLGFRDHDTALLDGQQVRLSETSVGKEITAQSDNLIVRVDEQIEIDHLESRSDFLFGVKTSKKRMRLGERIQIRVTPKETSIAPLVRLYLPGCLALLKGGANAQTAHLPIEQDSLVVDAVAVRPGRGRLYVTVHDMYDADKIGTIPGIELRVRG